MFSQMNVCLQGGGKGYARTLPPQTIAKTAVSPPPPSAYPQPGQGYISPSKDRGTPLLTLPSLPPSFPSLYTTPLARG